MIQPLSEQFNIAVRTMARKLYPCGFDVSDDAPITLKSLTDHVNQTGRMLVWSGASDNTIFADREVNWEFRAWHDWCHWRFQFPFTYEGERSVYHAQVEHLRTIYGRHAARKMTPYLFAEVIGQLWHQRAHGEFPTDQRAFVEWMVARGPNSEFIEIPRF